jgi:hypothetical protein
MNICRSYTKEWCGLKVIKKMYSSPYTDTTYRVIRRNCPCFSCSASSSLLMLTAGPRGQFTRWCYSKRKLSVCSILMCPYLWLGQSEFHARFKKIYYSCVIRLFKPCTKLTLGCNHRSGHLKTEHTVSRLLLRRHLVNWSRGPAVSMRNVDSSRYWQCMLCCVGWEIH